jgi:acyl-coenzyme A thioesterase PaaI-like protein
MEHAIQDHYADHFSHCYGCGRLNEQGLQIKSYIENGVAICRFTPRPYDLAVPGVVYGGLLASLIDCHGVGAAVADRHRQAGLSPDAPIEIVCVTGSLHVDYLKPTPIADPVELQARVTEVSGRKSVVAVEAWSAGTLCARGKVLAVEIPNERLIGAS